MPIRFCCPLCGAHLRAPAEAAGRKGRCPACRLRVRVAKAHDRWYYSKLLDTEAFGPVTSTELRALARTEEVGPFTRIWGDPAAGWVFAWQLKGLFEDFRPAEVSDRQEVGHLGSGRVAG